MHHFLFDKLETVVKNGKVSVAMELDIEFEQWDICDQWGHVVDLACFRWHILGGCCLGMLVCQQFHEMCH